ncbi:hypothetical protein IFR05_007659 [Cadophora sp. M221]|nr:hypothetical protein IFR05_007659 [Cadophora sp. M221]
MSSSSPNHAFLLRPIGAGVPSMTSSTFSATRTTYVETNPGSPLAPFDQPPPYESQQSYLTRLQFVNKSFPHLRALDSSSFVNAQVNGGTPALKQIEQSSNVDLRGSITSFFKWMGSFLTKGMYISCGIVAATFISCHFTKSWTGFLLELAKIILK